MKRFFIQRWFLLALVAALLIGIGFSSPLAPLADARLLRNMIVATVLFVMALPLQAGAMWRAMRRPAAPLLAVGMNLGLLPLFAWAVSLLLNREMADGLLVAAATPCTLASASVWTRRAGGNDATSMLVTVITNLSCFLVTPLWLALLIGQRADSSQIDLWPMAQKLGLLVVLPITAAQILRRFGAVGQWASDNKTPLGVVAQSGILGMILIGAVRTGRTLSSDAGQASVTALDWLVMIAAVLTVHLTILAVAHLLAAACGFSREDRIAVGFAGSQKTLMVGLQVAIDSGILILPMVAYHIGQLLVDTVIADRLRAAGDAQKK